MKFSSLHRAAHMAVASLLLLLGVSITIVKAAVPSYYVEPSVDATAAKLIREYTSDERFMSPLVDHVPHEAGVPSPLEFLGYLPGAPGRLTSYETIKAYMERLAETSPNVRIFPMGRSNENREIIVVAIAESNLLENISEYAEYSRRLSDPRETSASDAEQIAKNARPIYYITAGLHSTETGPPEMVMELAHRLATGKSPFIENIRKHVITLITPVIEPDGRGRLVDWYYRYTKDHTDWDDMPPRTPPYWGKYVFHDNNRDGIQMTQPLTRHVAKLYFDYHPQVMLDLHESVPLLYVSAGTGPYGPNLDPIITSEWQWISNHEVTELTKFGMPGVWTWGFYTGWYPGYLLWWGNNHNSIGRFYETFGNSGATSMERELKRDYAGQKPTSRQWYRPWPPEKRLMWTLRNNTNYMETGVLVSLDFVARNGETILYSFWKKGHNALSRGKESAPHAWILPREGQHPYELGYLVGNLRDQGIEVHTLDDDLRVGEQKFHRGDYVVRMDQPYRDLAKTLLEPQDFPADAQFKPYDDVAWTLPLLYGVEASAIDEQTVLDAPMTAVTAPIHLPGDVPRHKRRYYLVPSTSTRTLITVRLALRDVTVLAAEEPFKVGSDEFAAGTWIIANERDDPFDRLVRLADSLSINIRTLNSIPHVKTHEVDIPSIAVFHSWNYTQDSGWVRYTFDRAAVPYTLINKDQLRAGGLRDEFDVIIVPSMGGQLAKDIVHGIDPRWGPMPYTTTDEYPHHGVIDRTPDMCGGMGFEGLANLETFVRRGGTLITLGSGSLIAVDFGIVRDVKRVHPNGFHNPGSIVRARVLQSGSNLMYGYSSTPLVFRGNLPLFDIPKKRADWNILQYGTTIKSEDDDDDPESSPEKEDICVSGHVKGAQHLVGKPAILDVPVGDGRVVIFSFNPMHRYLSHASFGFVYNAIMHWND